MRATILRISIKVVLAIFIVLFALFNYKIITFTHGISKQQSDGDNTLASLQTLKDVKSVKYYNKTIAPKSDSESGNYKYRIFIETGDDAYLLDATQAQLDAFGAVGELSPRYKPHQIKPVPFYVEIIVGIIVVLLPPISMIKKLSNKKKK